MKANFVFEKFDDKSDPIEDMGISGVVFNDNFQEIYKIPERELYKKWQDFMYQFVDKWICGEFNHYAKEKGIYSSVRKHAEVFFTNMITNIDGIINIETENGTYSIIPGERYIIKEK